MLSRFALCLMWLLHFLPLAILARVGEAVGGLAYHLVKPRRRVVLVNLAKCFPDMPEAERVALAKRHFRMVGRFFLEHSIMWYASKERFMRLVQYEDAQHLDAHIGRPVIILAPHFLGMDAAGVRVSCDHEITSMYQKQKDPVIDERIRSGRVRFIFGRSRLFSRQDGLRTIARSIKDAIPFFYLPDMDFGPAESTFVPFFGVQTATITGLSRLAKLTGAKVVPCVARILPGGQGYRARFYPAWEGFPTDDPLADTRRMNAFIEERVREMPEQYYWVHRRFKTRPPGEAGFY
jgi:KDO2-lipid IV(A) lauroyltransferase